VKKNTLLRVFIDQNGVISTPVSGPVFGMRVRIRNPAAKCTKWKVVSETMTLQEALYLAASEVKTSSAV
jgi:hypothetical protein